MADEREHFNYVLAGAPRHGKSEAMKELAIEYERTKQGKVIIVDPSDSRTWKYDYKTRMNDNRFMRISLNDLEWVQHERFGLYHLPTKGRVNVAPILKRIAEIPRINGLVVYDDFKRIISGSKLSADMIEMVTAYAHHSADVVTVYHCVNDVPPDVYRFASGVWLFNTNSQPNESYKKIPKFDLVYAKWKMIKLFRAIHMAQIRYLIQLANQPNSSFRDFPKVHPKINRHYASIFETLRGFRGVMPDDDQMFDLFHPSIKYMNYYINTKV